MVTHGGMNSIVECIYRQVPMLAYPLNRCWDQPGNAARIVFHGLGMRGCLAGDSPSGIYRKIREIRRDYRTYREKLQGMKEKVKETPDTLDSYIKSII